MSEPEITICMSHFRRADLLRRTLLSIECQRTDRTVEVVVVNDDTTSPDLLRVCKDFSNHPPFCNIRVFSTGRTYRWRNQNHAMNVAIQRASAPYLIIQNPESLHVGHVVDGLWSRITAAQNPFYCVKTLSLLSPDNAWLEQHEEEWRRDPQILGPMFAGREEYVGRNNKRFFFFCLGTTKEAMVRMGGFDEDIKDIGWDDDLLAFHAKTNGYDCQILDPADFWVVHQNHQRDNQMGPDGHLAANKAYATYCRIVRETGEGRRPPIANIGRPWGQIDDSREDRI